MCVPLSVKKDTTTKQIALLMKKEHTGFTLVTFSSGEKLQVWS